MDKKNRTWNAEKKVFNTKMNQLKINTALRFIKDIETDPKKDLRTIDQTCKTCTYTRKGSFQAFTNATCGYCMTTMEFVNSNVDILCKRCATMHQACKHCGGEMD